MNSTTLQYKLYKIYLSAMFTAIILSVPLALILPLELSFENGLIENAQIVILLFGAVLILTSRADDAQFKWFQRLFASGLVLIILRELSWGRVFFPLKMNRQGQYSSAWRIINIACRFMYVAAMLFVLINFVPVKEILCYQQPLAVFAVIILAIIFSYVGEHGYFIGKECGQILEELNELILYMTLPAINFYYVWQQKNPSS